MVSKKKVAFGQRLTERPVLNAPERWGLVGVRPIAPGQRLRAGAHLIAENEPIDAAHDRGYITSVAYSPSLEQWIGLALVSGGRARLGQTMVAADPVRTPEPIGVTICDPVFYDPDGGRMRA
jgi:sarcosine oxidase subunit alpha